MKHIMQTLLFNLGYVAATLLGSRDRTWGGDARLFTIAGAFGAKYTAPDGKTNFRFRTDVYGAEQAMIWAELNADLGQRYWSMRASDDDLVQVISMNRKLARECAASKVITSWLDQEYSIAIGEVKYRARFRQKQASADVLALARAA